MESLPVELIVFILQNLRHVELLLFASTARKIRVSTDAFVRRHFKQLSMKGSEPNIDYRLTHDTLYSLLQWPPVFYTLSIDDELIFRMRRHPMAPLYYRMEARLAKRKPSQHADIVRALKSGIAHVLTNSVRDTELTDICWHLCEMAVSKHLPYAGAKGYLTRVVKKKIDWGDDDKGSTLEEDMFSVCGVNTDLRPPDLEETTEFILWLFGPEHEARVRKLCKRNFLVLPLLGLDCTDKDDC